MMRPSDEHEHDREREHEREHHHEHEHEHEHGHDREPMPARQETSTREAQREPMPEAQREPMPEQQREPMPEQQPRSFMAIPDAQTYMRRFEAVQAEFIDEPRRAVEKAESLVSEAIDRMMDSLKEELHRSRARTDGADQTEQLRIAMKRYRDILHSFGERER
jgi:hypothetical protein